MTRGVAERKFKRPFGTTTLAQSPSIPRRSGPHRGAARLSLVLDLRLRMGEGSASGVPWGTASGRAGWRGAISNGIANAQRGEPPLRCAHVAPESTRDGEERLSVPVEFREYATTTLLVLDLVGTFVFALSDWLALVKERLDLFGVLALSSAASTAGGITRDVLIGAVPPAPISDWRYGAVSLLPGLVTFY
jgi:Glycine transporter